MFAIQSRVNTQTFQTNTVELLKSLSLSKTQDTTIQIHILVHTFNSKKNLTSCNNFQQLFSQRTQLTFFFYFIVLFFLSLRFLQASEFYFILFNDWESNNRNNNNNNGQVLDDNGSNKAARWKTSWFEKQTKQVSFFIKLPVNFQFILYIVNADFMCNCLPL